MDPDEVPSISRISEHLWLGNMGAAADAECMRNKKLIINCTPHLPNSFEKTSIYHRIPVLDLGTTDVIQQTVNYHTDLDEQNKRMLSHWDQVVPLVARHWVRGDHIYIHCHAGAQRSAVTMAAVLAFIARYRDYVGGTLLTNEIYLKNLAVKTIHSKRPIAFHGGRFMTFEPALDNYLLGLDYDKLRQYAMLAGM